MDGIHLDSFHDAVISELSKLRWLKSVKAYPEESEELQGPCAFFSVSDWDFPEQQPMNGQIGIELGCELLIVFGVAGDGYQKQVRNAAMAVCALVHDNRWGLSVGPAILKSAAPDGFNPELDAFSVWRVEWMQPIEIGKDVFANDGIGFLPMTIKVDL